MSPLIIPICTKVDSHREILNQVTTEKILEFCRKVIQGSLKKAKYKRKIILFNEIVQFTTTPPPPPQDGRIKSFKYLRDLVGSLCDYSQGQFFVPNSWNTIGKQHTLCPQKTRQFVFWQYLSFYLAKFKK